MIHASAAMKRIASFAYLFRWAWAEHKRASEMLRRETAKDEWTDSRYGEDVLNQKKWEHEILDPFDVRDDWFVVLLPSLQLVLTTRVPKRKRKLAEFTVEQLGLRDSEVVVRYRREFFAMYRGESSRSRVSGSLPRLSRGRFNVIFLNESWERSVVLRSRSEPKLGIGIGIIGTLGFGTIAEWKLRIPAPALVRLEFGRPS